MATCHTCQASDRVTTEIGYDNIYVEMCKECIQERVENQRKFLAAHPEKAPTPVKAEQKSAPKKAHKPQESSRPKYPTFTEVKERLVKCSKTEETVEGGTYTRVEWHDGTVPIAHGQFRKDDGRGWVEFVTKYRYTGEAASAFRTFFKDETNLDGLGKELDAAAEQGALEDLTAKAEEAEAPWSGAEMLDRES